MDSSVYTLIGALGGVVLTQLANYFLEDKRSSNRRKDEGEAHSRAISTQLRTARQEAYSLFLAEMDYTFALKKTDRMHLMLQYFYSASIISSPEVKSKIIDVFDAAQKYDSKDPDTDKIKRLKGELLNLIRNELIS